MNDEEVLYREKRARRIRNLLIALAVISVVLLAGHRAMEWVLTSMGLQAAPADFGQAPEESGETEEQIPYGYVQAWTGEDQDSGVLSLLPDHEITVEDYRLKGLTKVGRPSATQEKLSTDLFIVINDDDGNLVLETMTKEGISPKVSSTFSVLVRDNPANWQTLTYFDPVTVTMTVPDDLTEAAFVDELVVYAVYNRQYPDDPGGLTELPVSVSEEDGICYASFLVRDEYETEYALCEQKSGAK